MIREPAAALIEQLVNRSLALDQESLETLGGVAGKLISVELIDLGRSYYIRPSDQGISVSSESEWAAHDSAQPDVTVRTSVTGLVGLLAAMRRGQAAIGPEVAVCGDVGVVHKLGVVAARLDIDWEEPLARWVGDSAAHYIGRGMRALWRWGQTTGETLLQDIGEFVREEARLAPTGRELENFSAQVDEIRDDVERLEQRVARLGGTTGRPEN